MSKERLEEIKNGTYLFFVKHKELKKDMDWLIEQAERVQELEEENRILRTVAESNKYIGEQYLEQNKRYKQALERIIDFYPGVPNADFIPVEMLFEIKGIAHRGLEREE